MRGDTAVVEMARASGLALVAAPNDPLAATTHGTGELIRAALDAGVRRVLVAVGGSATSTAASGRSRRSTSTSAAPTSSSRAT